MQDLILEDYFQIEGDFQVDIEVEDLNLDLDNNLDLHILVDHKYLPLFQVE